MRCSGRDGRQMIPICSHGVKVDVACIGGGGVTMYSDVQKEVVKG